MTMPGETIATGAAPTCSECGVTPKLQVCLSPGRGDYYVGTYCSCGPYSRETDYMSRAAAEKTLAMMLAGDTSAERTTEFNEEGAKQIQCIELDPKDLCRSR